MFWQKVKTTKVKTTEELLLEKYFLIFEEGDYKLYISCISTLNKCKSFSLEGKVKGISVNIKCKFYSYYYQIYGDFLDCISGHLTKHEDKDEDIELEYSGNIGLFDNKELIKVIIENQYNRLKKEEEDEEKKAEEIKRLDELKKEEARQELILKEYNRISGIDLTNEFTPQFKIIKEINKLALRQEEIGKEALEIYDKLYKLRDKYYSLS